MTFEIDNTTFYIKDYEPKKSDLYEVDNWQAYELTASQADFITLKINLAMHGETLEGLHEGFACCGFIMAENEADIIEGVLEHTMIYDSLEDFLECARDNYDFGADIWDGFADFLTWDMGGDCLLMAYNGKIYRRIYC